MGLSKSAAEGAVDAVFETIVEALAREEAVRIAGFGTFATRSRSARAGREPADRGEHRDPGVESAVVQGGEGAQGGGQRRAGGEGRQAGRVTRTRGPGAHAGRCGRGTVVAKRFRLVAALIAAGTCLGTASAGDLYVRAGPVSTARPRPRSPTLDCSSVSPAALYGCGRGGDGGAVPLGRRFRDGAGCRAWAGLRRRPVGAAGSARKRHRRERTEAGCGRRPDDSLTEAVPVPGTAKRVPSDRGILCSGAAFHARSRRIVSHQWPFTTSARPDSRPCVDYDGLRNPVDLWLAAGGKFHRKRRRKIPSPAEVLPRWRAGIQAVVSSPTSRGCLLVRLLHRHAPQRGAAAAMGSGRPGRG